MTNTMIWISIVEDNENNHDVEILDAEPTESFRMDLWSAIAAGDIRGFQIREGYVNGGDSQILYGEGSLNN